MANKRKNLSSGLQQTLFQPSGDWIPPIQFPDLSGVKKISIDIETRDPELLTRGPGFIRGDADVVGIALAADERSWYFPIGHLGGGNLDRDAVGCYFRDLLSDPDKWIVGANLSYELDGLESLDISIAGRLIDIQILEALIDEERDSGYSLHDLCKLHLRETKQEGLLRAAADAYGIDPKGGLWKLPSKYVGAYAEYDAACCLKILDRQMEQVRSQSLEEIIELEMRLIPVLHAMRWRGIPIDLDAANLLSVKLRLEEEQFRTRMIREFYADIDVWSAQQIARVCDQRKIIYPRTTKGNPSFEQSWLDAYSDPFIQLVADIREVNRQRSTFVDGWIFKNHIKGRIHPQWKQMVSDDGGTRTGRMAASNPNPQQIPAGKYRTTGKPNEVGKAIRSLFVSDTGKWCKFDYSQQEPRILTHFASMCNFTGANLAKMAYVKNPKMDFYQFMVEAAGIDRRPAKDMYLGRCYGMGKDKLATKLGKSVAECEIILRNFDEKVPFVKEIADRCMTLAQQRGYIKTLCGRRRHFNYWEPVDSYRMRQQGLDTRPRMEKEAHAQWPGMRLQRSNTHKALNALIQGSAADMMKSALVLGYEEHDIVPYITVHDEVGGSVETDEDVKVWQNVMEHCVKMCVPIKADMKVGRSWS